ncbi:energy-coupling factor transporter transmembrane component T [Paratractidigestivibacter sp.]|uniref:energy-coupling factor transporter transmembrane component T family protein n=1 Tax=Paratractidigestivibacter sp. TaxID=2847316 RepID=UPI002AC9C341|nr:energy-coupling factor transporter transmembrane component T [Paratractidigestivibacter sp.]
MAFKLRVGQYFEAASPIHALDARVKFCCTLAALIALFCSGNAAQLALGAAFTLAVVAASRVPAERVAESVKPLVIFLGVLSLFNLVFVQTGNELLVAGPLRITEGGVWAAVLYTVRFGLALMLGSLILLTTTPTALSDAFDSMLSPLARLGLPAHEIAMVFSLMLRFVPTIADEASAILDAQAMRGGGFDEGGPVRRVRAIVPVVVALLASGLRHADGLARALDARCYEGGEGRTHLHEQRVCSQDFVAIGLTCAFIAAMVVLGVVL